MTKLNKVLSILILSTLPFSSYAKESLDSYNITGTISEDMYLDFRETLTTYDIDTVLLSSGGGDLISGMKIGELISRYKINTYVPKGVICASACSYIFMSGYTRVLHGSLGMHEFTYGGTPYHLLTDSGKVIALPETMIVANYLGFIGVHIQFLLDSLETNSDDLYIVEDVEELNKYLLRGNLITK